jgi:DNA polymerase I-like protein with 3'-5' exonuclease and polymerase domains
MQIPPAILVDATNFDAIAPQIIAELQASDFAGIDTETQDDNRHAGLMAFCKYDPITRKKAKNTKTVFDLNRTVMTGFSLWPEGVAHSYYINLAHADMPNRLPWEKASTLVRALPESGHWVAHNAMYEIAMFRVCHGFNLPRTICTLQMAVSAFGPDEYDHNAFLNHRQGGIKVLLPELTRQISGFTPEKPRDMKKPLAEVVSKILAKESDAAHSYNGYVKEIAYGYGLKRLVQIFFGHKMTTFEECLGDHAHMGQLTGAEVCDYGADDAYWAMRLFRHLMAYMAQNCPTAIPTFFAQENPMVAVFADIWVNGMKVNADAVIKRRDMERINNAQILRDFKAHLNTMLPFNPLPHAGLAKHDAWYSKNDAYLRYRQKVVDFASTPNVDDPFLMTMQARGPVSNAWAIEKGVREADTLNLSHYMPVRTLIYDLTETPLIIDKGKVQSDGEARGKLMDRFTQEGDEKGAGLIQHLNEIATLDQRMKLYLTPYSQLMDPDTGKLYPVVSSMLATRRMGAKTPNAMQLQKRGDSTYVRGFFEADYEDHVIISVDWSGIELVEIGEFSGDPEFCKAFAQLPHDDLHGGAAADILSVEVPGLDEEIFNNLKKFEHEDDFRKEYGNHLGNMNRLFTDLKGNTLGIEKVFKYWRGTVGKGSNFGYWYSGFLGSIGDMMGWDMQTTGQATEKYRQRFAVAEQWRMNLIDQAKRDGFVMLPDGHRRVRFEATDKWHSEFLRSFLLPWVPGDEASANYNRLWNYIANEIQKRAARQAVNAVIQGSCATIAKRSILRINEKRNNEGWGDREMRFMMPIHDELLYSVHKDLVVPAIGMIRGTMIDHPDLFTKCLLDAAPAVGRTFEPWHPTKAPVGQIEIYEAPKVDWLPPEVHGGRMNDDQVRATVDFLFHSTLKAVA